MLRLLKRRRAIKQFIWNLPFALNRRFGEKSFYSPGEVSRTSDALGFDKAFVAYAHALFCSRKDFEEYYSPLKVRCTYESLRKIISKKYFNGSTSFDAASVYRYAKDYTAEYASDDFHESGAGFGGESYH